MATAVGGDPVDERAISAWQMAPGVDPLPFAGTAGIVVAAGGAWRLYGYSFRETAGAAAVVDVFDGQDGNGQLVATLSLSPGQSVRDWFGPHGLRMRVGVCVRVTSGAVTGAAWALPHRLDYAANN